MPEYIIVLKVHGVYSMNRNFLRGSKKSKMSQITSDAEEVTSKIAVEVFSFKTFYYIVSVAAYVVLMTF